MAKAQRSGISVQQKDVPIILAMVARGDRRHDIAAWFGLNQGRIKEVEDGKYGIPPIANGSALPPAGSPGPKARALRAAVVRALSSLRGQPNLAKVTQDLTEALAHFDRAE